MDLFRRMIPLESGAEVSYGFGNGERLLSTGSHILESDGRVGKLGFADNSHVWYIE